MPLLKGEFDPKRLNAVNLAEYWASPPDMDELTAGRFRPKERSETEQLVLVDRFQALLDNLAAVGIIR